MTIHCESPSRRGAGAAMAMVRRATLRSTAVATLVVLLSGGPSYAASIAFFSGGDVGEGLDLDGSFAYAVNVGGPGGFSIRDAGFTSDNATGVTVSATYQSAGFAPSNFGATANDNNLELVMQSIRFSAVNDLFPLNSVDVALSVAVGAQYRLQLLFKEGCVCDRGFDVLAEGATLIDDLGTLNTLGGQGKVVTHDFTALDETFSFSLAPPSPVYPDNNPILNGFTLELLVAAPPTNPDPSPVPEPASLGLVAASLAGLGVLRRRKQGAH